MKLMKDEGDDVTKICCEMMQNNECDEWFSRILDFLINVVSLYWLMLIFGAS